jgi:hemoglobin
MSDHTTLYEQIGGRQGVEELVDNFYDRVLADPRLEPFFREASIDKLRKMQQEFFASALDGPATLSELDLSYVHYGRGIRTSHFNRFVQHLLDTLASIGVGEKQQMEVIRRISTYVNDITGEVSTDS